MPFPGSQLNAQDGQQGLSSMGGWKSCIFSIVWLLQSPFSSELPRSCISQACGVLSWHMCNLVFGQILRGTPMHVSEVPSPCSIFLSGILTSSLKVLSLPPQLSQIVMLCCVPPSCTTNQKMSRTNMELTSFVTLLSGVIVVCRLFSTF